MGRRNFNPRRGGWLRGTVVGGHGGSANVSSDSPGKRGGGRVVSRASKGIGAVSSQDRAPWAGQSSDDARGRVRTGRPRARALPAADTLPLLTVSPLFLFPHQSAQWFLIGRAILIMKIARETQKPFSTSVVLITFSHSCVASDTIASVFPWLVSRLSGSVGSVAVALLRPLILSCVFLLGSREPQGETPSRAPVTVLHLDPECIQRPPHSTWCVHKLCPVERRACLAVLGLQALGLHHSLWPRSSANMLARGCPSLFPESLRNCTVAVGHTWSCQVAVLHVTVLLFSTCWEVDEGFYPVTVTSCRATQ